MTNWFAASAATMLTPLVMEANNGNAYPAFLGFGAITLVLFGLNFRYMVETKGRTTAQIAKLLADEK